MKKSHNLEYSKVYCFSAYLDLDLDFKTFIRFYDFFNYIFYTKNI